MTCGYFKSGRLGGTISFQDQFPAYVWSIEEAKTLKALNDKAAKEKEEARDEGEVHGDLRCVNPRCITTTEQELVHQFRSVELKERVYRCIYCEKDAMPKEEK